jgi:signal peptidase
MTAAAVAAVERPRRWMHHAPSLAAGLVVLALGSLLAATATGYRPLVVRSGSMAPAIETGDVVMSKLVGPASIEVGDVVTFRDPSREGALITHRVLDAKRERGHFSFVTKGDANTGLERWSVSSEGTVGRVALRVPRVGYLLTYLGLPLVRVVLLAVGGLILAVLALRRIWTG